VEQYGIPIIQARRIAYGTELVAHLARSDAQSLLIDALSRYRKEHRHPPARVVLHKTSSYTADEIAGFRAAADAADVDTFELLWLAASDPVRLFRSAAHRRCAAPC
jgi:hypothetical protein